MDCKLTVLLLSDVPQTLVEDKQLLEERGHYIVHTTRSAEFAADPLTSYDVILLHMETLLPDHSSPLTRRIRRLHPETLFIGYDHTPPSETSCYLDTFLLKNDNASFAPDLDALARSYGLLPQLQP